MNPEPPDAALLNRLDQLIRDKGIHRDPELTFATFVARMGAPEADVRRLINHQLGYRHFRSFLNAHRIADARAALADPVRAADKMVAIAFDAGFGSMASFNREFTRQVGCAPSEFRAEAALTGGKTSPRPGATSSSLGTGF